MLVSAKCASLSSEVLSSCQIRLLLDPNGLASLIEGFADAMRDSGFSKVTIKGFAMLGDIFM